MEPARDGSRRTTGVRGRANPGQGDVSETLRKGIGQRHDSVALGNRQGASRQEVVLQVDNEEDIAIGGFYEHPNILAQPRPENQSSGKSRALRRIARFSRQIDTITDGASGCSAFSRRIRGSPTRR